MFVPFDSLPGSARIWIFQISRNISGNEAEQVRARLLDFTQSWVAHNHPLKTSFEILFNRFIVLAADESHHAPSGCSIDSSFRVLKSLEHDMGFSLFDRSEVAFKIGDEISALPMTQLKDRFAKGVLDGNSLIFNNVIETKADLDTRWIIRAADSWVRRYITDPIAKVI